MKKYTRYFEFLETKGELLKRELGLENIESVVIQKVLGIAQSVYVVTYDSRRPTLFISNSKLRKLKSSKLKFLYQYGIGFDTESVTLSPAFDILYKSVVLTSNTIIIQRDLAGELYYDRDLVESKKYKVFNYEAD